MELMEVNNLEYLFFVCHFKLETLKDVLMSKNENILKNEARHHGMANFKRA